MTRRRKKQVNFIPCGCGCGELIAEHDPDGKPRRFKNYHYCRVRKRDDMVGPKNSNWKGGRWNHSKGYIARSAHGYPLANAYGIILEHRMVWMETYNACLLKWADVHHKDGNKKNNVWYNLQGMMKAQHTRNNAKKDMSDRKCSLCGKAKTHHSKQGHEIWYKDPDNKQNLICHTCYHRLLRRRKRLKFQLRN